MIRMYFRDLGVGLWLESFGSWISGLRLQVRGFYVLALRFRVWGMVLGLVLGCSSKRTQLFRGEGIGIWIQAVCDVRLKGSGFGCP